MESRNGTAEDPFDTIARMDEESVNEGFRAGRREGAQQGFDEGREYGITKGYETGVQLGFFAGAVRMWQSLQKTHPSLIPERSAKGIAALAKLIDTFPLDNPEDERFNELLEQIQGKFKAVASGLGGVNKFLTAETEKDNTLAATGLSF